MNLPEFFKILKNKKDYLKFFTRIGPEAISKDFNKKYLDKILKNRTKNIKNLLLDQKLVSGLGNIYVNEAIFMSKINPKVKSNELTNKKINALVLNIKKILKKAIYQGGSSIKDFNNIKGKKGNFQQFFNVYGRQGKPCTRSNCKGTIRSIRISNRSTFFCDICQK